MHAMLGTVGTLFAAAEAAPVNLAAIIENLAVAALIIGFSVLFAWYLAKQWRMPDYFGKFALIFFTTFAGMAICVLRWDQIKLGIDLRGGVELVYDVVGSSHEGPSRGGAPSDEAPSGAGQLSKADMDKLIAAVGNRINPAGTKEVTVRQYGPRQIQIIIPEVDKSEVARLKKILETAGNLEFRILATPMRHKAIIDLARAAENQSKTEIRDGEGNLLAWWVPVHSDEKLQFSPENPAVCARDREYQTPDGNKATRREVLVVKDEQDVTGKYLVRASRSVDENGKNAVSFNFNNVGGRLFGVLTSNHTPDPAHNNQAYHLGIVLDGVLRSAPTIRTTINDQGQITGSFTVEEVSNLVDVLNAGALPATLKPGPSELQIGATLGKDTIEKGLRSLTVSMILVFVSVLLYYRFAGIVACVALVLNGVLLLAIMILVQATFSLPGLAGFALTLGMAVDANVLIYERMREEAARGAQLKMVIRNGFDRALSAIIDSNLTTMITALVLYAIGRDQVRGFAVTLFLGIVLSMFTAIFVARVIFDVAERRRWIDRVNMMQAIGETRFDFLKRKWLMAGISAAVIVLGFVLSFFRGSGMFDIDFTGGVSIQALFDQTKDIGEVREKLGDLQDVVISEIQLTEKGPDGKEVARPGSAFVINTSTPPGKEADEYQEFVRNHVIEVFGPELTRNKMTIKDRGPAKGQPAVPALPAVGKPSTDKQSFLSPGRTELLAATTLLLGAEPAKETPKEPAKPEAKPEVKPEVKPEAKPAAKPEAKPAEVKPEMKPEVKPEAKPEVKPEAKPEVKPEAKPEPKPAAKPEVVGTHAALNFKIKIEHDDLKKVFDEAIHKLGFTGAEVTLTAPGFVSPDAAASHADVNWEVTVPLSESLADQVLNAVERHYRENPYFAADRVITRSVAQDTQYRAGMAMLASMVFILAYLWIRFQRATYGLGAITSLVHDVFVTLAFVAGSYWLAQIPLISNLFGIEPFKINLVMTAAFLTIAGYSLNDTIVIFDRIREVRGKAPYVTEDMINLSINQTLGRTLLTGLTSMMVIVILYIAGGPTIHGFAFAMIIGVVTGTYSSIYIASPFLLWISSQSKNDKKA